MTTGIINQLRTEDILNWMLVEKCEMQFSSIIDVCVLKPSPIQNCHLMQETDCPVGCAKFACVAVDWI